MAKKLTSSKAKEILHDKSVHGHPLTDKQRRFFGAIAGGAKPYKAEEGGWLDKYEQGGLILKKKTKDNFGKKANPNDVDATVGPNFEGWAYNTKGRNYSPAWGGQFQMGGKLTFLEPTSKKLPAGYNPITGGSSTEYAVSIGGEDGEPAYLIPSFKYGELLYNPKAEFKRTGEHLGGPFKTYQEADEWERTVRHPYVEKGQNIPTPLRRWGKDFAMGGSMPGAVGFTYARTINPAPANGKYTKKTLASAQNGDLLKIQPQRMISDATRVAAPIIPLTEKEKAEAAAKALEGQRKAAERDKKIVAERQKKASTKGDINVPGTFGIAEKARLFPQNVGGMGQLFDEYVNPMYAMGSIADALGESVARRDPKAFATTAALTAAMGAFGFDPLGAAIKSPNIIKKGLSPMLKSTYYGETPSLPAAAQEELGRLQRQLERSRLQRSNVIQSTTSSNPLENIRVSAEELRDRLRTIESEPDIWEGPRSTLPNLRTIEEEYYAREFADVGRVRLSREEMRDRFRRLDAEGQPTGGIEITDADIQSMMRDVMEYEASAAREEGVSPIINELPSVQGPKFGDKDFKLNIKTNVGLNENIDPETGFTFRQNVEDYGNYLKGDYTVSDPNGYVNIKTKLPYLDQDPYLNVKDLTFFNRNEKSATTQFNKLMSNLPPKVKMNEISTSMYSQPLMNQQVARWANNQPGRIEFNMVRPGRLNPITKNASPEERLKEYIEQFPKVEKTYKTLSEKTGYQFDKPQVEFIRNGNTGVYSFDEFTKQLSDKNFKDFVLSEIEGLRIRAPKYELIKHWKDGGNMSFYQHGLDFKPKTISQNGSVIDPRGQWAYPGEITTIPSNEITMEGVDYDVVGISNTGDKKLMKPGKNYKFKGDYVTEYPKGGWLDKYK
jgi:hypothetical protein